MFTIICVRISQDKIILHDFILIYHVLTENNILNHSSLNLKIIKNNATEPQWQVEKDSSLSWGSPSFLGVGSG
jgi:hypothetical protein